MRSILIPDKSDNMLKKFYNTQDDKIWFSRQQASDFAKQVADDFNPLHDIDAKRFCVPGDLLFAVTLEKAGLNQQMKFEFSGMVTDNIELNFPDKIDHTFDINDEKEKVYVSVTAEGENSQCSTLIESLISAYVGFSGHTFPHILCQLMAEKEVMINPARPMIMYESMEINMTNLTVSEVSLKLASTSLTIDGKRGNACLAFDLFDPSGEKVGSGVKHMVLSGLRPYCAETIADITSNYLAMKERYHQAA